MRMNKWLKWLFPVMLSFAEEGGGGDGGGSGGEGSEGGSEGSEGAGEGAAGKGTLLSGGEGGTGGSEGTGGDGGGTAESWFVGLYDQQGNLNHDKFDSLPDHLKSHKDTFAKYKTVDALLGGMGNLSLLAGKKALQPLPDNAPDDVRAERDALMKSLNNVPKEIAGYGIQTPEGVEMDPARSNEYLELLHKSNAHPELVKELFEMRVKDQQDMATQMEAAEVQQIAGEKAVLEKEFGVDFKANIDKAQQVARTLGIDMNSPIGNSSELIKGLVKVHGMISEDKFVSTDGSVKDGGMTNRQKALDIVNNPANPLHEAYQDVDHAQHDSAVQAHSAFNKASTKEGRT